MATENLSTSLLSLSLSLSLNLFLSPLLSQLKPAHLFSNTHEAMRKNGELDCVKRRINGRGCHTANLRWQGNRQTNACHATTPPTAQHLIRQEIHQEKLTRPHCTHDATKNTASHDSVMTIHHNISCTMNAAPSHVPESGHHQIWSGKPCSLAPPKWCYV